MPQSQHRAMLSTDGAWELAVQCLIPMLLRTRNAELIPPGDEIAAPSIIDSAFLLGFFVLSFLPADDFIDILQSHRGAELGCTDKTPSLLLQKYQATYSIDVYLKEQCWYVSSSQAVRLCKKRKRKKKEIT